MGSAQGVFIMAGDQPRAFAFGNSVNPVYFVTANQNSLPLYKQSVYSSFQAILTGTGALTATVAIQASNDDNTGRGFVPGGLQAPGFVVNTASSTTLSSPGAQFTQAMIGATVSCPGVPVGTTLTAVAANGASATMSAAATATANAVQAGIYANNWLATAMGTITLSGSTVVTDGFQSQASWRYVRAAITNITGTGATVNVLMGV